MWCGMEFPTKVDADFHLIKKCLFLGTFFNSNIQIPCPSHLVYKIYPLG